MKRPYGTILRGTRPNQVVALDYVYIEESYNNYNRILIITDTFSNFSIFDLASSESSEDALETISTGGAGYNTEN